MWTYLAFTLLEKLVRKTTSLSYLQKPRYINLFHIIKSIVLQEENQQPPQANNAFPGNFQNVQQNFPNFQQPNFGNFQNFAQPNAPNLRRNLSQTRMNERAQVCHLEMHFNVLQVPQDQNYNPLEQIQMMQLQIQSMNEQLQRLYNYVAAQQANNANINPNPSDNRNTNTNMNERAVDDMSGIYFM